MNGCKIKPSLNLTLATKYISKPSMRHLVILFFLLLQGCSSIFFFPMREHVLTPDKIGIEYSDIVLRTPDNLQLHGWLLPPQGTLKGTVYFLHGNAENISTHLQSVYWLPKEGYQVFLIDYRGYGLSEGEPELPAVLNDIKTGFDWLIHQPSTSGKPIFLLGQSLGASMGIYFIATTPDAKSHLSAAVLDAPFTAYSDIARHVASRSWITWALQYPASWLMISGHDPIDFIAAIAPVPILLIHSNDDKVIPFEHSTRLYSMAIEPKSKINTRGPHTATFNQPYNRRALLHFFERFTTKP